MGTEDRIREKVAETKNTTGKINREHYSNIFQPKQFSLIVTSGELFKVGTFLYLTKSFSSIVQTVNVDDNDKNDEEDKNNKNELM
ncbi:hypothetical protein HPP92_011343 [Vanilla planifolia]|uniref:Uncharacterized protein n=1 Tax=Vanilla planifolia TaxID=51239 RepID=A0A835R2M2_VANPL|nr:hypothetical protein HPP92_011343 [Vanilla planifolia]